jgi:hypothetical protein
MAQLISAQSITRFGAWGKPTDVQYSPSQNALQSTRH